MPDVVSSLKRAASTLIEIQRRSGQVRVGSLVASITLRAVTSLIPLVLVGVAITGLLAQDDADLGTRILNNLQVNDPTLRDVVSKAIDGASGSAGIALVISVLGSLWLGLGVVGALADAFNAVWQVPGRGFIDKLLGVPWLICAATVFGLSGFLAAAVTRVIHVPVVGVVAALGSSAVTGFFAVWVSYLLLTNVRVPPRAHVPGAFLAGVFLAVFQLVGSTLVRRTLEGKASTYSTFAGIFALFFVFNLFGRIIASGCAANVVLWERTHGTTQLLGRAPALPFDVYTELERGGQRPHPAAGSPLMRLAKALLPKKRP
jgi:membrane protein